MLRKKGTVLRCYANMAETVTFSEIGMSVAVLEAGYNIDSLMLRYQACASKPSHHHLGLHRLPACDDLQTVHCTSGNRDMPPNTMHHDVSTLMLRNILACCRVCHVASVCCNSPMKPT